MFENSFVRFWRSFGMPFFLFVAIPYSLYISWVNSIEARRELSPEQVIQQVRLAADDLPESLQGKENEVLDCLLWLAERRLNAGAGVSLHSIKEDKSSCSSEIMSDVRQVEAERFRALLGKLPTN